MLKIFVWIVVHEKWEYSAPVVVLSDDVNKARMFAFQELLKEDREHNWTEWLMEEPFEYTEGECFIIGY